MELELELLGFANYVLDNDYNNALAQVQKIAALKPTSREDILKIKETFISLVSENYQVSFSNEQINNLINALNLEGTDAFVALLLFNQDRKKGMGAKEFKASKAYQYLNQDNPVFLDSVEKHQFISTLAMTAIAIRDKELINFMLNKVSTLNA